MMDLQNYLQIKLGSQKYKYYDFEFICIFNLKINPTNQLTNQLTNYLSLSLARKCKLLVLKNLLLIQKIGFNKQILRQVGIFDFYYSEINWLLNVINDELFIIFQK
ncbi:hypothetical protein ABPG72_010161 [Tetrahymena utriculariae]